MNLHKLVTTLDKFQVPYMVIGGYAVALHGALRMTVDIDLLTRLTEENLIRLEKAMKSMGYVSRLPVTAKEMAQFRTEYIEKRNLIAWTFVNPKDPTEVVDILITHDMNDFSIAKKSVAGVKVSVISIEGLIALKKESARPQDLEDIKSLKEIQKYEKK